jgi:hypothetical protein
MKLGIRFPYIRVYFRHKTRDWFWWDRKGSEVRKLGFLFAEAYVEKLK